MDTLQGAILNLPPNLYDTYLKLPQSAYEKAYQFDLVNHKDLCSMTRELEFHTNMSYMAHEVVELVYSENSKAPPQSRKPLIELVVYLDSVGFQYEGYALKEFLHLLIGSSEDEPSLYTFGYAPTDPTIADFIREIRLGDLSPEMLYRIKADLLRDTPSVIRLLKRGVPYDVIAGLLSKERYSWALKSIFSIFGNEQVVELLGSFDKRSAKIPMQTLCQLADLKNILVKLPDIFNKKIAMAKLLLIIYFPEHAQFIYNARRVAIAFKDLVMEKLAKWRRDIAMKLN